jgi:hypothetical protein
MQRSEVTALFPVPAPGPDRAAVREQLERILASPLFRNSKRYPSLLRYVVEQVLDGHGSELKERTLGIEVFGRTPDYDTNLDPVVRISAAEIRKRIAQYYHEAGREEELRIDLPLGSYVPEFRFSAAKLKAAEPPLPAAVPLPREPVHEPPPVRQSASRWRTVSAVLAIALVAVTFTWLRPWVAPSALDRFWAPVITPGKSVMLCIGRVRDPDGRVRGVPFSDSATMARIAGVLQAHRQPFTIRAEDLATFGDLRQNPAVLIGAFNDSWSLRLANSGRFTLHQQGDTDWIQDAQNPADRKWAVTRPAGAPPESMKQDFGLISRVIDPSTDRIMVMVGGLWGFGTLAAGEFLSDPKYLEAAVQQAPAGWQNKNIQIVISTEVIKGNSGPPKAVAIYAW